MLVDGVGGSCEIGSAVVVLAEDRESAALAHPLAARRLVQHESNAGRAPSMLIFSSLLHGCKHAALLFRQKKPVPKHKLDFVGVFIFVFGRC